MKKVIIGIVEVIILFAAYYLLSPIFNVIEVNEVSPVSSESQELSQLILLQGDFQPGDHEVSGRALLIKNNMKKY